MGRARLQRRRQPEGAFGAQNFVLRKLANVEPSKRFVPALDEHRTYMACAINHFSEVRECRRLYGLRGGVRAVAQIVRCHTCRGQLSTLVDLWSQLVLASPIQCALPCGMTFDYRVACHPAVKSALEEKLQCGCSHCYLIGL